MNCYFLLLIIYATVLRVSSLTGPALYQLTSPFDHGEGPTWDNRTQTLYFVDLLAGKIISYKPNTGTLNFVSLNGDVTPVIPTKSNPAIFIVGLNRSVVAVHWNGSNGITAQEKLTTVSEQFPASRFNDGKADKNGRLWFGTMGFENSSGVMPNEGSLYFVTRENIKNPLAVISPVNISNGLAWNKANNKFYYIDTPTRQVKEYDYDEDTGSISNPRVAFDVSQHTVITGHPDGMTIDKDDNLWVALYDGGAVIKVNPVNGTLLQVIAIPSQHVTSVSWGGPNFDILFVTTSRYTLSEQERLKQPAAGSLFALTNLGTNGLSAFEADIVDEI